MCKCLCLYMHAYIEIRIRPFVQENYSKGADVYSGANKQHKFTFKKNTTLFFDSNPN